jgi:Ca2+-binding EF-hand superfamily protein
MEPLIKELFDFIDTDKTGTIGQKEFITACKIIYKPKLYQEREKADWESMGVFKQQ